MNEIVKLNVMYHMVERRRHQEVTLVGEPGEDPKDACKRFAREGLFLNSSEDTLQYVPGHHIINIEFSNVKYRLWKETK